MTNSVWITQIGGRLLALAVILLISIFLIDGDPLNHILGSVLLLSIVEYFQEGITKISEYLKSKENSLETPEIV
jgi:hypothetical protein